LGQHRAVRSDDNEVQPMTAGLCRDCRHFRNDAKYLETIFSGMTSLSSAYGSTRSDDGVCLRHDRYLRARSSCRDFSPEIESPGADH
jgi:hypothetical protein